ncbi:hypothetical protein [Streptomyces sp. NPDC057293]|uniref:hypothetical protein n=1 Tax=unclassified Streptomyces TaxID=2593676 RepID=UPI003638BFCB
MTFCIRSTDDPNHFDLFEDEQKVGELVNHPDREEDGTIIEGSPEYWYFEVWSQMGTGRTFSGEAESFEEAKHYTQVAYEDMSAERRELRKGSRPPMISTPMGGQKRRR